MSRPFVFILLDASGRTLSSLFLFLRPGVCSVLVFLEDSGCVFMFLYDLFVGCFLFRPEERSGYLLVFLNGLC
jgi:hypothetical protein